MKDFEERRYERLSPFELKNKLIQMARTHHERMMRVLPDSTASSNSSEVFAANGLRNFLNIL